MCAFRMRQLDLSRLSKLESLNIQFACEVHIERIGEKLILHELLQMAEDLLLRRESEYDSFHILDAALLHILNNVVADACLVN